MRFVGSLVINTILLTFLLALVFLPTFGGEFLVSTPPPGQVAGLVQEEPLFDVSPNLNEFNFYVRSSSQAGTTSEFKDSPLVTVFHNQIAIYNHLYFFTNSSQNSIFLKAKLTSAVSVPSTQKVILSLAPTSQPYFTQLTRNEEKNSTLIEVEDTSIFKDSDWALVGNESIRILDLTPQGLISAPFKQKYEQGEKIYPQAVWIEKGNIETWETHSVRLEPGEEASLTLTVVGQPQEKLASSTFTLPFAILASFSPTL